MFTVCTCLVLPRMKCSDVKKKFLKDQRALSNENLTMLMENPLGLVGKQKSEIELQLNLGTLGVSSDETAAEDVEKYYCSDSGNARKSPKTFTGIQDVKGLELLELLEASGFDSSLIHELQLSPDSISPSRDIREQREMSVQELSAAEMEMLVTERNDRAQLVRELFKRNLLVYIPANNGFDFSYTFEHLQRYHPYQFFVSALYLSFLL